MACLGSHCWPYLLLRPFLPGGDSDNEEVDGLGYAKKRRLEEGLQRQPAGGEAGGEAAAASRAGAGAIEKGTIAALKSRLAAAEGAGSR